jgi:hypothetical protein
MLRSQGRELAWVKKGKVAAMVVMTAMYGTLHAQQGVRHKEQGQGQHAPQMQGQRFARDTGHFWDTLA